jgi:hypothetical protein
MNSGLVEGDKKYLEHGLCKAIIQVITQKSSQYNSISHSIILPPNFYTPYQKAPPRCAVFRFCINSRPYQPPIVPSLSNTQSDFPRLLHRTHSRKAQAKQASKLIPYKKATSGKRKKTWTKREQEKHKNGIFRIKDQKLGRSRGLFSKNWKV